MGWLDTIVDAGKTALKDNAGGIAAGVAGAVLGSGTNKGGGSTTTSITSVPTWMSDYAQQLLAQANMAAAQPYQQYTGPRVAGQNQDQLDAGNMIRQNAGQGANAVRDAMGQIDPNAGQGMLAQAGQFMNNAGGNWLDHSTNFMDDYKANVTDPSTAQAMRTWNEQINPSIQGTFAGNRGVGAYGSSAMLKNMTDAGSRLTEKLGENQSAYLDRGYNAGMGQFNTQNNQQGQLAQIAQGLGRTQQDMNLIGANNTASLAGQWANMNATDANALNAVGGQQQTIDQNAMNVDYSNWLESQGYDKAQIEYLSNMLNSSTPFVDRTNSGSSNSSEYVSPLQAATQGYSLYNAMTSGKNPNTPPPASPKSQWELQGLNDPFNTQRPALGYTGP